MDQAMISYGWHSLCENHKSHLAMTTRLCSQPMAELVRGIVTRFVNQDPPATEEELLQRQFQEQGASSIIGALGSADSTLRLQPGRAAAVLEKARQLAVETFPSNEQQMTGLTMKLVAFNAV